MKVLRADGGAVYIAGEWLLRDFHVERETDFETKEPRVFTVIRVIPAVPPDFPWEEDDAEGTHD